MDKTPVRALTGLVAEPAAGMALGELVAATRASLEQASIADAPAEARRLVCDALELDHARLLIAPDMPVDDSRVATVSMWLRRRCEGEPLARIRGWQDFYGRNFLLSPATLEPRSDSETLIDAVLEAIDARQGRNHPWRIVDVGTGTGCLALTLLAELPHARAVGTDISAQALNTARTNAEALGLSERAQWLETSFLTGLTGAYDIIVSNPPYIRRAEIGGLEREVRLHDPFVALDGGDDGLDAYRAIAQSAIGVMGSGLLVFETAADDAERVVAAARQAWRGQGLSLLKVWHDLRGRQRCVALQTLG